MILAKMKIQQITKSSSSGSCTNVIGWAGRLNSNNVQIKDCCNDSGKPATNDSVFRLNPHFLYESADYFLLLLDVLWETVPFKYIC